MMGPEQAVLAAILLCVGGSLLTLLVSRQKTVAGWLAFVFTVASAVLVLRAVWGVLVGGTSPQAVEFWSLPAAGLVLRLHVDGLTAFFLLLAVLVAVPASLYSISYMRHYPEYGMARFYPFFLLFLAALYGLLSATDMMWVFFILWQVMVLAGYALIAFEYRRAESIAAARKFALMMEIACAALMAGSALLVRGTRGGNYDFGAVSAHMPDLLSASPTLAAFAFALVLVGCGIKMGMWPFGQVWLPDAHASAPASFSAMISGVMIKVGVYRLLRYFLWLIPVNAQSGYPLGKWGGIVTVLGTITLLIGTLQALKQEQSKRLLAFHSIGQVGYILFAAGMCMTLLSTQVPAANVLATLALFGALLHALNHAIFKALLALNAGSMLQATGTQDLNQMGGLMKYMPITAITALIASFSISGIPLFNGFVSKWTIYVAGVQGGSYARLLPLCVVIAILTSAVTLASFIKFFGASFLSRTSALVRRRAEESRGLEAGWLMQVPQVVLAFLCILLGLFPAIAFDLMHRAIISGPQGFGSVLAERMPVAIGTMTGVTQVTETALFVPLALAVVLGLTFLLSFAISRLGGAQRRAAAPWLCGYAREADCHRYVAHNFYGEIKTYLRWAGGAEASHRDTPAILKEH